MKKIFPVLFSFLIALGIAYYRKQSPSYTSKNTSWNTFEKKSSKEIVSHPSTGKELEAAKLPEPKRGIAQEKISNTHFTLPKDRHYRTRENRILLGELGQNASQDEDDDLEMVNRVNPDWKKILGNDLLRFHEEETKVLIKEEYPIIKVQNGRGQYLEQVVITYVFKNGNFTSFHALVDSDTGFITETWDKIVHEKVRPEKAEISLPDINNSGIIAR